MSWPTQPASEDFLDTQAYCCEPTPFLATQVYHDGLGEQTQCYLGASGQRAQAQGGGSARTRALDDGQADHESGHRGADGGAPPGTRDQCIENQITLAQLMKQLISTMTLAQQ